MIELLVQHGVNLEPHDTGSRDSIHTLAEVSWQAIDHADGRVRVGVRPAIAEGRTRASICVTDLCN